MRLLKETKSLCPECLKVVPAQVYEEDGKVYITKCCEDHGEQTEIYWSDYQAYLRAEKYANEGVRMENPRTKRRLGCPLDCGICDQHKSTTTLGIIDVTNRCNLRCPICFAHAGASGILYEPTLKQIREMMENLMANEPVWTPALQISGGEPTVREDLPEILEMAHEVGFVHVEVNSNGIKMAESPEYCRELKEAGMDTVYLQFDGVTPEPYLVARGFNLFPIKKRVIENLRSIGFRAAVLVPVLVKGVNDNQVGDIIQFAIDNKDVVRAVNFQPVSITGRVNKDQREKMRITIPELMHGVEEQTGGFIKASDWYPVPTVAPLSKFMNQAKNSCFVDFSAHPHCGMATYLYFEGDDIQPLTRIIDVDRLLESLRKATELMEKGKTMQSKLEIAFNVIRNIRFGALSKYLTDVIRYSNYRSLNDIHHSMIMIGSMHFMDPYNYDLERVQRCVIHYATPDGRIIPFCSYNIFHRKEVEQKFGRPIKPEELTPLYDVESLLAKIKAEEERAQTENPVAVAEPDAKGKD